jgi:hypothetical protein
MTKIETRFLKAAGCRRGDSSIRQSPPLKKPKSGVEEKIRSRATRL